MDNYSLSQPNRENENKPSEPMFYGQMIQPAIQEESQVILPEPVGDAVNKERWRGNMKEIVETLVLALLLFIVINTLSIRIQVDGFSMVPSFDNEDMVIVNRLAFQFGEIQRGDVVVFALPQNPDDDYIKRVIAVGGDTIRIEDKVVYVNGFMADEPYIKEPPERDMDERLIPEGSVFVMGDNRNDSNDSRAWGPLPVENIIGKAFFVYFPFDNLGIVTHEPDILMR